MSEKLPLDKLYISDDKLRSLWKYAVNLSLGPDNEFPAYKLYYILLKKEIFYLYCTFWDKLYGLCRIYCDVQEMG